MIADNREAPAAQSAEASDDTTVSVASSVSAEQYQIDNIIITHQKQRFNTSWKTAARIPSATGTVKSMKKEVRE